MEAIFNRRSIRKYEEKPVEKEKIEKLLRAAMQAPSAANQQPWEFIVVEDKTGLKKLSETKKAAAAALHGKKTTIPARKAARCAARRRVPADTACASMERTPSCRRGRSASAPCARRRYLPPCRLFPAHFTTLNPIRP